VPRKKQQRIFVYQCDYCGKQHENHNAGSDYIVTAAKNHYCRGCHDIVVQENFRREAEAKKQLEEKRKRVYGKREFTKEEQEQRQRVIIKAEAYLKQLRSKI
jgi:predicted CXXCH cytochrome family protein